jgi:hypothetical protein
MPLRREKEEVARMAVEGDGYGSFSSSACLDLPSWGHMPGSPLIEVKSIDRGSEMLAGGFGFESGSLWDMSGKSSNGVLVCTICLGLIICQYLKCMNRCSHITISNTIFSL